MRIYILVRKFYFDKLCLENNVSTSLKIIILLFYLAMKPPGASAFRLRLLNFGLTISNKTLH